MKNSRQFAFEILNKIQKDNSYSNLLLDNVFNSNDISVQDRKFTSVLVYGVIERMITLDYQICLYLTQPLKKLKPQVLTILRLGSYQLLFMDKVPPSAAINESVKLSKSNGAGFASGLINAVLRKISNNGVVLPNADSKDYLSVKYSVPKWLCDLWSNAYGAFNAEKLAEATVGATNTVLKVNNTKISSNELVEMLKTQEIFCEIQDNYIVANGALHKTKAYRDGLFHVQDKASQLCCKAVNPKSGDRILDVCGAPGGKSFTLAEMLELSGEVVCCDIHKHRVELIKKSALRLGLSNVTELVNDGTKYNDKLGLFDRVLCDVPCAGLGVIRKKPEIKYKDSALFDNLPDLQYSILDISSRYVNENGYLFYSTCSLNPNENENVVNRFLKEHGEFISVRVLDGVARYSENTDYITLMPHIHNCDGFFIAGFQKIG